MTNRMVVSILTGLALVAAGMVALAGERAESDLLTAVPSAKQTLAAGIRQSQTKAPEAAISAKFELDDKGQLSLSVYTAEKGLSVDAEHNVLKELSGSPAG